MILISHRGNIKEPLFDRENTPSYIDIALSLGYDVEVDIRYINDKFYLGHDNPSIVIGENWISKRKNMLWFHCKNIEAATRLAKMEMLYSEKYKFFCHSSDMFVLTSTNHIWVHDLTLKLDDNCIIPLLHKDDINNYNNTIIYGICTDYVSYAKHKLKENGLY